MRIVRILLIIGILSVPLLSNGEMLYLRDGSVLKATIKALDADSIHVVTSFGRAIAFARADVIRIEFSDSAAGSNRSIGYPPATAEPGSLLVMFDSQELSSKVVVNRNKDLARSLAANAIEELLYIDNEVAYSYVDTTMDKTIRNGAEKIYKNTITLQDIRIALPAGPHALRLVIASRGRMEERESFEYEPLLETLERSNTMIYPGKTTRLVIEVKRRKWGMGGTELRVSE